MRGGKGKTLQIRIFDGCWVGANSVFLGKVNHGLEVGPSSVIGCMSNVIKNVEPNVIVAGNPAKIIKRI